MKVLNSSYNVLTIDIGTVSAGVDGSNCKANVTVSSI